ncbi:MAG: BamA/TamA family outer membrane protein [Bryobacterales bacterium]|nr:BamA/TamA family outer membrane protein [Bryobacterales bacterium]
MHLLKTTQRLSCISLYWSVMLAMAISAAAPLCAQDGSITPDSPAVSHAGDAESRAAVIEQARARKALTLVPDVPNKWEVVLSRVKDEKILERITEGFGGFRAKLGGLAPGAGMAIGPEYYRDDLADGSFVARAAAQFSFGAAQKFDLQLTAPRLAHEKLEWDFQAVHHNYPHLDYYGPGADSRKTGRSNYRLEDTTIDTTLTLKPVRYVRLGASLGYLFANTGPGSRKEVISTDKQYPPAVTSGIDSQANALRYGVFAQVDYRDNPGGPRSGGSYTAQYNIYRDQELNRFDFSRLTIDLQQYFPMFNQRRVVALRARTNHSFVSGGQAVPFYLQNILGGNSDLRGYRPFRFYGDNSLLMNAEWRWEVFSGLDMAIFTDAGKVMERHRDFNFRHLESDVGFGLRFNARNNTFMRLDVAFSHEGYRVWLAFGDAFAPALQRTSSNSAIR